MTEPIHSPDVERGLLAAMMISIEAYDAAAEAELRPEHFFVTAHKVIAEAVYQIAQRGVSPHPALVEIEIDTIVGAAEAKATPELVAEIGAGDAPVTLARDFAVRVRDDARRRQIAAMAPTLQDLARGTTDAEALLVEVEELVAGVDRPTLKHVHTADTLAVELRSRIEGGKPNDGIPTGIRPLDELLGGLSPGRVYVIAGRPSMGKSAVALQIGGHFAAEHDLGVYFASLEMPATDLFHRLVSSRSKTNAQHVERGAATDDEKARYGASLDALESVPLVIDDQAGHTVLSLSSRARQTRKSHGLGLIIVDYLQLVGGSGYGRQAESRQLEVAAISRHLKLLARDLEVPVIALSQLSRNLESRPDKRPMLSDLRDSGAIEQDADAVVGLYRDEVYNPDTIDSGIMELIVLKHREGAIGTLRAGWIPFCTSIVDIGDAPSSGPATPTPTPALADQF